MKITSRIIAFILSMSIMTYICMIGVFASTEIGPYTGENIRSGSIFEGIANAVTKNSVGYSEFMNSIWNSRHDSGCPSSSGGGYHSWKINPVDMLAGGLEGYWHPYCEYCNMYYAEYLNKESLDDTDISAAYSDYTDTLPATGLTSSGTFVWQTKIDDFDNISLSISGVNDIYGSNITFPYSKSGVYLTLSNDRTKILVNSDVLVPDAMVVWSMNSGYAVKQNKIKAPMAGTYTIVRNKACEVSYTTEDNRMGYKEKIWDEYTVLVSSGEDITLKFTSAYDGCGYCFITGGLYCPSFTVTPSAGAINTTTGTTINDTTYYDIDSRPASISGDYGILGDNNELTKIDSQSIVNETDNSVYNPVTDTTYQVTSWDYDYSDRSYNLTLEGGDMMTVTYGDENVSIKEGDTIYNVYYVVETPADDSESGNTENHTHTYTSTVTRESTCTTRGVETYTCSECSNSYTKQLPALGHDWLIDSEVFTTYDENGDIVTQGYKIYKCTRCGDEYKSEDGTPPDSGGDSTDLTITDPTDDYQSFWERMKNFFQILPEMFGDLTEFLKDGWPYVPDEVMTLIEFGLGMVVFVGILNWLFKR